MYDVFVVDSEKKDIMDEIISDDLISRQTTSVRDGKSLGFEEDVFYALIEGSEEAIERAKELFSDEGIETADNSEEIKEAIKKEDEAAAQGMGTVFG